MRPLFHPSVDDITVEAILHALSDPVRVAIYAEIAMSDCTQICSAFLNVKEKAIPKSTLSQHFKALREAGLIRGERRGVEMHNMTRCAEIEAKFPGLLSSILNAYISQAKATKKGHQKKTVGRRTKSTSGA
ncbi:MAG: helix-turn-helix domain-containing protein [Candidatus Obscuribacterales bacterium]|nr:helix-turn-helix domain-containing protein [Candidatus Obscuribacterales bacterium]